MGLNIVKEGSWLYFVNGEVGGEHTFPTCLELPCSNSLHSDYATFEITCGVSWYFIYIGITPHRLRTSDAMFVDRMAVFLWVTSSDKLLQVDHFKPNFVLLGWQHPETSEMSSCSRTKRCPRIMCWVIPVVYLTVPDILMVPWRYLGCLLSKSWAKCEPMTVDGALARLIQPVQKKNVVVLAALQTAALL